MDLLISRTDGVVKPYTNWAVDNDVSVTSDAVGTDAGASADAALGDIDGCVAPLSTCTLPSAEPPPLAFSAQ